MKWLNAEDFCQKFGGHLASITNERIHNFMKNKLNNEQGGVYITAELVITIDQICLIKVSGHETNEEVHCCDALNNWPLVIFTVSLISKILPEN